LTRFTETGHLDASNAYVELCVRAVAVGRHAFLFVGSERTDTLPRSILFTRRLGGLCGQAARVSDLCRSQRSRQSQTLADAE
jgi:hypothetical protein